MLQSLTEKLNENIDGSFTIESMEPAFLQGFPNLSLNLKNIEIKDRKYETHKRIFLKAEDFYISVNALALLRGTIQIKKISVGNAQVNLFTDVDGYSNSSVFKKNKKSENSNSSGFPELRELRFDDVLVNIENFKSRKKYRFQVNSLKCNVDYNSDGWNGKINLDILAESMTFSMKNGSFIANKSVEGTLQVHYNENNEIITFEKSPLEIGGENFTVSASFSVGKTAGFTINIANNSILWRNASQLLSPNISSRLNMFDLKNPISVTCLIKGDFNEQGDPLILVKAKIRDNELDTPGGKVYELQFRWCFYQ
ncbi:AsmA family protein [Flavobacterium sp. 3HN19-14]|uniref:AsmA family protein n=1 Tax=Flavobacterium sp. 3HN19-14 TaxID=3448133 RepID=UPI003EE03D38